MTANREITDEKWLPVNANQEARLSRIRETMGTDASFATASHLIGCGFRITGHLDCERLRRAVRIVAGRHAAIRTKFEWNCFPARQKVTTAIPELTIISDGNDEAAISALVWEPFDLRAGVLARFLLAERHADWEFWLVIEHLVADGWSVMVLLEEISRLYDNPTLQLPVIALQNHDLGILEENYCSSDVGQEDYEYWASLLRGGSPWLKFLYPGWRLPDQEQRPLSTWAAAQLADAQAVRFLSAARMARVTPFVVVLDSLCRATSRLGMMDTVPVMFPTANRSDLDLENTVGFVSNMVPIMVSDQRPASRLLALEELRDVMADEIEHSSYPIHRLTSQLAPEEWGSAQRLPFLYLDVESVGSSFSLTGTKIEELPLPEVPMMLGIVMWCGYEERNLTVQMGCPEGFLPSEEISRLLGEVMREMDTTIGSILGQQDNE